MKLILSFLLCALPLVSISQTPLRSASTNELIERLTPSPMQTRGLRNLSPESREKPSIDLSIQFEFDSSKIASESKPLLDSLALAMNSYELKGFSFMVTGYTDGVGLPAYNQRLSEQRAQAVLNYLATIDHVNRNRLTAVGRGSKDLLFPDSPDAAENRRVRIAIDN